jgi:WXG100 family type VII secretion target
MSLPTFGSDGRITYDFGSIADMATAIRTYVDGMNDGLLRLFNEFQGMFDSRDWAGAAGTACKDAHKTCHDAAGRIKDDLDQVSRALHLAGQNFHDLDTAIANSIGVSL